MEQEQSVRADKFLWAVRLFKTRSLAVEACQKNRITIGSQPVKSSRIIKPGDIIEVKTPPILRTYKVLKTTGNRMGAKLVPEYLADITPPEQIELIEMAKMASMMGRRKGLGRPTKKERRDMEQLMEGEWE